MCLLLEWCFDGGECHLALAAVEIKTEPVPVIVEIKGIAGQNCHSGLTRGFPLQATAQLISQTVFCGH